MSGMHIIYTPRPDASPESETAALAAVYRFVIEAASKRDKATEISGGKDAKGESEIGTRESQQRAPKNNPATPQS